MFCRAIIILIFWVLRYKLLNKKFIYPESADFCSRFQNFSSQGRVWSQNAINAKAKKSCYLREKIDYRQANTIPGTVGL